MSNLPWPREYTTTIMLMSFDECTWRLVLCPVVFWQRRQCNSSMLPFSSTGKLAAVKGFPELCVSERKIKSAQMSFNGSNSDDYLKSFKQLQLGFIFLALSYSALLWVTLLW